jgi:hypothetical protein
MTTTTIQERQLVPKVATAEMIEAAARSLAVTVVSGSDRHSPDELRPGGGPRWKHWEAPARTAIQAALAAAPSPWQPIESAPIRKVVLIGRAGEKLIAEAYIPNPASGWRHIHSCDPICFAPTHWMPLPDPPTEDKPRR